MAWVAPIIWSTLCWRSDSGTPETRFADGWNAAIEALRRRRNEWDFPKTPWGFRDEMMGCGHAADYLAAQCPEPPEPDALARELAAALERSLRYAEIYASAYVYGTGPHCDLEMPKTILARSREKGLL